jgi:ABC-type lipoprotein release transport system permease subunit
VGVAYGEPFTTIYVVLVYLGAALAVVGIILGLLAGNARTWLAQILSIIATGVCSGLWGAGRLTIFNFPPPLPAELFWPVFVGWVLSDYIVLSVISTALLIALTPVFKRTGLLVKGWWA